MHSEYEDLSDFLQGLGALLCSLAAILVAAAAGLAFAYLNPGKEAQVIAQIVAENDCKVAKEKAAQYAGALVHLLNRGTVVIGETKVSCRVKESS